MVSQVGLNTSVSAALPALSTTSSLTNNAAGSLFTNYSSVPTNDYTNDVMMQGIDFGQIASTMPQAQQAQASAQPAAQAPQQQVAQQTQQALPAQTSPAFSGNNSQTAQQTTVQQAQESQVTTAQEPKSSNIAKIMGAATGLLAPLVPKTINLFKGGKFKDLFKVKELAVSCPIFGVVGLGIGMLLDSCLDAKKSKSSTTQAAGQQNQTEIIQNFLNGQQSVKA